MNVIRPHEQPFSAPGLVAEPPSFGWIPQSISFIRRRWRAPALAAVAFMAVGMAYVATAVPVFSAEADLLIDIRRTDLLSQQHEVQDAQTLNAVLESQVAILSSEGLAEKVVARLNLLHDPQFNHAGFSVKGWLQTLLANVVPKTATTPARLPPADPEQAAVQQLMGMTSVRRLGLTYVIQISVKSGSAEESARLANGLVDAYIFDQLDVKETTTKEATTWLQDRLLQLKEQAAAADTIVQRYKADKEIVDTDKGLINEQRLAELNSQLTAARARTAEMKARLDQISAIMQGTPTGATVAETLQSGVINTLRQKYLDDARQVTEWQAKFGPNHTAVVKLRAEMDDIQQAIRNELGRIAETYKSDYAVARADEISVEGRMGEVVSLTARTNGDRVALRSLQSSADTYRSVYENFLTRYTQAVQDQSFPISEARVITAAKPPLHKSGPNSNLILGGAGFVGFGIGLVAALARETLDRSVRTPAQLRTLTGLQCIGLLPGVKQPRRRKLAMLGGTNADPGKRLLARPPGMLRHVLEDPASAFTGAIRSLRFRVCRRNPRLSPANLIGFVSASHGEGTSTVAANLAQFMADAGYKTLLVDWVAGPGSLSGVFAPGAQAGLLDLVAETSELEDVVWTDPQTGLHFLPTGSRSPRIVTALMGSPQMRDVLAQLRTRYEYVICDVPALSEAADAHTATHLFDALVLVVGWGLADPRATMGALAQAESDDIRVMGAVLTGVDFRSLRLYPRSDIDGSMLALS